MTYYERLKNRHDRHLYESPEEKGERFRRLLERQEFLKEKDLYKCECREELRKKEESKKDGGEE